MQSKALRLIYLFIFICVLHLTSISGETIPLTDWRTTTVSDNSLDVSFNFHTERDTVFSINKTGDINIGDTSSFYGSFTLVPAFNDGTDWFLCPLKNMNQAKTQTTPNSVGMDNPDETVTCYKHTDTKQTKTQKISALTSYTANNGRVKIASTVTFKDILPADTGFAFFFKTLDSTRLASAQSSVVSLEQIGITAEILSEKGYVIQKSTGTSVLKGFEITPVAKDVIMVGMASIAQDVPVAKDVQFVDENGAQIGDAFDWADMLDFGYKFSEVIELGGDTGLLLGTYGYGSSNTISIDPTYQVDYSPIPAEHLQRGNVTAISETAFANITDITAGVSDNLTTTNYSVFASTTYSGTTQSTGYISPTSSGGSWSNPDNAYADDGTTSSRSSSGTGYWAGYNFSIPSTTTITSIRVRLDASKNNVGSTIYIGCINLSWNNGTGTTTCQSINPLTTSEVTYTFSGLWGRNWTPTELNTGFQVHVTTSAGTGNALLDWIPVEVNYTTPQQNYSNGSAMNGKWSVTYNPAYQYFLRVYKTTSVTDTIRVYAKNSTTSISTTSTSASLAGTGWFNVNVTSLVQYMSVTLGLNFTGFRFYTDTTQSFSEELLRQEANDSIAPTIASCQINASTITNGQSARLKCNVTDNLDVATVNGTISSVVYPFTKDGDWYYNDFTCTLAFNGSHSWTNVTAVDILGNLASTNPSLSLLCNYSAPQISSHFASLTNTTADITFNTDVTTTASINYGNTTALGTIISNATSTTSHIFWLTGLLPDMTYYYNLTNCDQWSACFTIGIFSFTTNATVSFCIEDWVAQYGLCQTNDSQLKTYTDMNGCGTFGSLPFDNGTYIACNYCSENLIGTYSSGCYLYLGEGRRNVTWSDSNYFSCCAVTNILADCSIHYSPYNATTFENCTYLRQDFSIDLDLEVFFGFGFGGLASDKVYGKIWLNDTNSTYYCVSYVKSTDGELVQTNPPYTKRTTSTISITPKEIEDREFFITQQGLANIYWTDHNLVVDGRQYIFGVECSGHNNRLISEQLSKVFYKPLNAPITRWFWAQQNTTGIVLGFLLILIIVFAVAFLIWQFRRSYR
ncbi:hypothetical protein MUP79_07245 [Candidatus Bathyarchaeota archaeon]|nr:hypothetical protein [Candidatus Bathyarchaeota archaeon]